MHRAEARPYFRDVHGHLTRLDAMIGGLIEVIRAVFEASNLLEQQRQGIITGSLPPGRRYSAFRRRSPASTE
jgi:hypothetical protein